jgi:hypothetical protein
MEYLTDMGKPPGMAGVMTNRFNYQPAPTSEESPAWLDGPAVNERGYWLAVIALRKEPRNGDAIEALTRLALGKGKAGDWARRFLFNEYGSIITPLAI